MGISTLFVYGTLMRGMSNHARFCGDALTIKPAFTTGRLYHLPYGYPAMFSGPDGQVFGDVMTFPNIEKTIKEMDHLEGYRPHGQCHYIRIAKRVTSLSDGITVPAWAYVYPEDRLREIRRVGAFIPHGCWREFMMSAATHLANNH